MPTYEYACDSCGRFEHYQGITEAPLEQCPRCAGSVRRLIPRQLTVIFKGPGFHVNDYRKGSPAPATEGGGAAKEAAASD